MFQGLTTLLKIAELICAGLGSGWLPKMPGTWGSMASLLPLWLILEYGGDWLGLAIFTIAALILGCVCCFMVLPQLEDDDPGWIVIDEWAGLALTMLMLSFFIDDVLLLMVLSFVTFRLFDIWKPWPIKPIEHLGPAWWSIMADDLMAGLMAGGLVIVSLLLWRVL